jgi:undecaprenyl-diphosphatase
MPSAPVQKRDLRALAALLTLALLAWVFIVLTDRVVGGRTHQVDEWVLRALGEGPPWLTMIASDLTALGSLPVLGLLVTMVAGHLLLLRRPGPALVVVLSTAGGGAAMFALKALFDRPRPQIVPHLAQVATASYPSGHALLSAVVYLTLGILIARFTPRRSLRAYFLLWAFFLTGVVGASRVSLGVHYPSDVVAGWCFGGGWALAVGLLVRTLQRKGSL